MKLLLVAAIASCGRSEPPPTWAEVAEKQPPPNLASSRDLLVGIVDDWKTTKATLRRYRRDGATWKPVGEPWPAVVGASGTGWGVGLHGVGAPTGRSGPLKREGDGKSPAGVFALGKSYGYAKTKPAGSRLEYTALDDAWKCIDDPKSASYNRVIDSRDWGRDWKSAEDMKRADDLYSWVVDIAHNPTRTPDAGSCIFLHVWRDANGATAGCTAMAAPVLADLIATLDPQATFVLLPKAEYSALAASWGLPP